MQEDLTPQWRPPGPPWFSIMRKGNVATLRINGEIGIYGQSADDCIAQLAGVENVKLEINSPGGCCGAAFRIADAMQGRCTVAEIFGSCFSAATIIALAAAKIRIERNARMMIHPVKQFVFGDRDELLLEADKIGNLRLRWHRQVLSRVCDDALAGKWLSGPDFYFSAAGAVKLHLADEIFDVPAPATVPVPGTIPAPEQTEDETLFHDILRGLGRLEVANKEEFFRRMGAWMRHNVVGISAQDTKPAPSV